MQKLIKNGRSVIVMLDNGTMLQNNNCTDELFAAIKTANDDNVIIQLLVPKFAEMVKEREKVQSVLDEVSNSKNLTVIGNSIYWRSVSELSLPMNLVYKIIEAEKSDNSDALESYHNFWTLLSLNPDERVRQNLFWFLSKWGMRISKSGLFLGYRNVDVHKHGNHYLHDQAFCDVVVSYHDEVSSKKKSLASYWIVNNLENTFLLMTQSELEEFEKNATCKDDIEKYNLKEVYNELKAVNFKAKNIGDDTVFTDHRTHSFRIKIGEIVSMERQDCDYDSNVPCSFGLHLGGERWINENYFGTCGLVCLCNPRDVVAVSHTDDYGKLRTCAYLPIARCEYDKWGKVIPYNVEDGFDSRWVKTILYDGIVGTEDNPSYRIEIPPIPGIDKIDITEQVLKIARKYMK